MVQKSVFFYAGCPVCVQAEQQLAAALDPREYSVEVVHFGQHKERIAEAERLGVRSVPALVLNDNVFHINFGASMQDVRQAVGA